MAATEGVRVVESIGVLVRLFAEVFGSPLRAAIELLGGLARSFAELAPAALTTDTGALVLATALVATLAVLAVALALFVSPALAVATEPRPRRAIADATRLTQSHPDAPGHSRPRAPGLAALAA